MSYNTSLCVRCQDFFKAGELPKQLNIFEPHDGDPARETALWNSTESAWIEVAGYIRERFWEGNDMDIASLEKSAHECCYICARIWRRCHADVTQGVQNYPPTINMEYRLDPHGKDRFILRIRVYGISGTSRNLPWETSSMPAWSTWVFKFVGVPYSCESQ